MYDTVFLRLTQAEASGVDFTEVIPRYLDNCMVWRCNDAVSVRGSLNGLAVSVTGQRLEIRGGSLCKFLLGDNYSTLGRSDAQRAIEKLSDSLHLQMERARVGRMDVAQNFIMKHPVAVYLNHLGELRNADRLEAPCGLYYSLNGGRLCFYDKNREWTGKRGTIPALYIGRNVLRYERRYTQRIAAKFKVEEVTGEMLYNEAFYTQVLQGWRTDYQDIMKVNDISTSISIQNMKTKRQQFTRAMLSLVREAGGQLQMLKLIKESQQRGELTNKQAFDWRKTINEACQAGDNMTTRSDAIKELDEKVSEAVRYYR